ncbi:MAG: stage II sporulation protein P [Clostridiaceae bacterium]
MPYITKANNNLNRKVNIFILTSAIIVLLTVVGILKLVNSIETSNNMLYIEILNYTLPIVKEEAFDASDMAESNMNLKKAMTKYFKLDINNPLVILSKENALFSLLLDSREFKSEEKLALTSFNLEELSIFFQEGDKIAENSNGNIYNPDIKKNLNETVPEVLLYHTHTTEYYSPATAASPFSEDTSVVAVGKIIAEELQKNYGISVVHDKTIHNTQYNNSYTRSGETLSKYLNEYSGFKVIIDIHRDAGVSKNSITCSVNNQQAAKLMFVLSKASPNYQKNLELADSLKGIIDQEFPGVMKEHKQYNRGKANFNLDKAPNSALIEVGSEISDIEEAKLSGQIIARAIAEYINKSVSE